MVCITRYCENWKIQYLLWGTGEGNEIDFILHWEWLTPLELNVLHISVIANQSKWFWMILSVPFSLFKVLNCKELCCFHNYGKISTLDCNLLIHYENFLILLFKFINLTLDFIRSRSEKQMCTPIHAHFSIYSPVILNQYFNLLDLTFFQSVDLFLRGTDYQLGNKKHMLQITVQFTENVWTLTANTSVSSTVCTSLFKSLWTLITRSSIYFRAKQTLNYLWSLNHLWTVSLRVLKLSNKVWNFMKHKNALFYEWSDLLYDWV